MLTIPRLALQVAAVLFGLGLLASDLGAAVEDPYTPWMQGRPAESVLGLERQAQGHDRWSDWYDCGLAAAAASEHGTAVYSLLRAHHLAPLQEEPLQALRATGIAIPPTWCERLGVLAWPGGGWSGAILLTLAGVVLGLALARRMPGLPTRLGLLALLVAAPGAISCWHDAATPLLAVVEDTSLLDSTGNVIAGIASGTVVHQEDGRPWNGRVLVLANGKRGWLPLTDTQLSLGTR
jgi:hypothetical protein